MDGDWKISSVGIEYQSSIAKASAIVFEFLNYSFFDLFIKLPLIHHLHRSISIFASLCWATV